MTCIDDAAEVFYGIFPTGSTMEVHGNAEEAARRRQMSLTKPPGALGRLEDFACWIAARQGKAIPDALKPAIAVFAADHGVTVEGVSAFPSAVTAEMVKNFVNGGAAINVLARSIGAFLSVVDVGVASVLDLQGIVHSKVRMGTANLLREAAMSRDEAEAAVRAGRRQAKSDIEKGANLLIAGEMGIGNTTASACLIASVTGRDPEEIVGCGTGIDEEARKRKIAIVSSAIGRAGAQDALGLVSELGGLEIAAMCGYYLEAADRGIPVVLDGFISAAAALIACRIEPDSGKWMIASHLSFENGHRIALENLGLEPILDLGMRLGEGTGAAMVFPVLQNALKLHAEMATFEQAGVSNKDG